MEDSRIDSGRFIIDHSKVLRHTPSHSERLARAYSESLMQQANNIREAIHSQKVDRYSEMIEDTYRMDREREEELANSQHQRKK